MSYAFEIGFFCGNEAGILLWCSLLPRYSVYTLEHMLEIFMIDLPATFCSVLDPFCGKYI